MGSGEEDHRSEVPFSLHRIQGVCYQHDLSLVMLSLISWSKQGLYLVSLLQSYLSPPAPYYNHWKPVTKMQSTQRVGVNFYFFEGVVNT